MFKKRILATDMGNRPSQPEPKSQVPSERAPRPEPIRKVQETPIKWEPPGQ
jgi:hypothetical protein